MKLSALFGWGIVIYAIMNLSISVLGMYVQSPGLFRICAIATLVAVTTIAGRSLRFFSWKDILPYSLGWVGVIMLLDAIIVVPNIGWSIYADWNVWFGYVLVALLPLLAPFTFFNRPREIHIT